MKSIVPIVVLLVATLAYATAYKPCKACLEMFNEYHHEWTLNNYKKKCGFVLPSVNFDRVPVPFRKEFKVKMAEDFKGYTVENLKGAANETHLSMTITKGHIDRMAFESENGDVRYTIKDFCFGITMEACKCSGILTWKNISLLSGKVTISWIQPHKTSGHYGQKASRLEKTFEIKRDHPITRDLVAFFTHFTDSGKIPMDPAILNSIECSPDDY